MNILFHIFADTFSGQPTINPTGFFDIQFTTSLAAVLKLVFMAAALLAVIFVAVGGLKYTLSNGDPQGVAKAKNTIMAALVGLVLAVFAFTIVTFVVGHI